MKGQGLSPTRCTYALRCAMLADRCHWFPRDLGLALQAGATESWYRSAATGEKFFQVLDNIERKFGLKRIAA